MDVLMLLVGLLIILAPGFLFSLVLFPRPEDLDFWERLGASFGLGLIALIFVGFFLAKYLGLLWRPFLGLLLISSGVLGFAAFLRGGLLVVYRYWGYVRTGLPKLTRCLGYVKAKLPKSKKASPQPETRLIRCPYCGQENPPDARQCTRCGSWLDHEVQV